jgi:Flp pilus assembly protein TadG
MNILETIRRWSKDRGGAAAVEMALVAPFLAVVVAGIASYAPQLDRVHKMHDAVSTGAGYVMTGGTDPTTIQSVAYSAWTNHGSSDTVTVTQWCSCAGVTSSCSALCTDSTVPQGYTKIAASTTYTGSGSNQTFNAEQTIRTR